MPASAAAGVLASPWQLQHLKQPWQLLPPWQLPQGTSLCPTCPPCLFLPFGGLLFVASSLAMQMKHPDLAVALLVAGLIQPLRPLLDPKSASDLRRQWLRSSGPSRSAEYSAVGLRWKQLQQVLEAVWLERLLAGRYSPVTARIAALTAAQVAALTAAAIATALAVPAPAFLADALPSAVSALAALTPAAAPCAELLASGVSVAASHASAETSAACGARDACASGKASDASPWTFQALAAWHPWGNNQALAPASDPCPFPSP